MTLVSISYTTMESSAVYTTKLANSLNKLRTQNQLCDIVINVEGRVFQAHRAVLAACSEYFFAMFTSGFKGQYGLLFFPFFHDLVHSCCVCLMLKFDSFLDKMRTKEAFFPEGGRGVTQVERGIGDVPRNRVPFSPLW